MLEPTASWKLEPEVSWRQEVGGWRLEAGYSISEGGAPFFQPHHVYNTVVYQCGHFGALA